MEAFPDVAASGRADLLVYFYARALQILTARRLAVLHHQQQVHEVLVTGHWYP